MNKKLGKANISFDLTESQIDEIKSAIYAIEFAEIDNPKTVIGQIILNEDESVTFWGRLIDQREFEKWRFQV